MYNESVLKYESLYKMENEIYPDIIPKDNNLIVQSNHLIEAHYRLTLQEKRLVLWLIQSINRHDTDFKRYKLSISEFSKIMELNPKTQYKEMKKITKSLIIKPIEMENTQTQETIQMSWLCFVHWKPRSGFCYLEFHPELKQYLLQLKNHFTQIGFADLLGLKSVYSVRIYELLMQYQLLGKRKMNIEDIRLWCGIKNEEYQLYAHLKSRVIEPSKLEINSKTEYDVDYTEIKESRKIIAIEWTIQKKKPQASENQLLIKVNKEYRSGLVLIDALVEYGMSKPTAKRLLQNSTEEIVRNAMKAVDLQIGRGNVKNPQAMLRVAIQEQWHPEKFKTKKKVA